MERAGLLQQLLAPWITTSAPSKIFAFFLNLRYRACIRSQVGRNESIDDFCGMTTELLLKYRQRIGLLPERILVYRDGVSDGK